jgi:inner membrane protein
MPTIFTHAVAASAIGRLYLSAGSAGRRPLPRGFWPLTVICAILPDADVVGFDLGLEYGHVLGHRGISHSLVFALAVGAVAAVGLGRGVHRQSRVALFAYFAVVTASHGILDAFTDDGLGTAFFAPFLTERYFFPWRPLEVSPIGGHGFFTARQVQGGLRWIEVLWSEIRWVWLPAALIAVIAARRATGGRATG